MRTKRKDGTYVVYIRVTQNRKNSYIKTDMYVHDGHLDKDKNITNQTVKAKCSIKIKEYLDKLNLQDTANWSVHQVVDFINKGSEKILFYPYCTEFINEMKGKGKDKTAEGYEDAITSFKKFFKNETIAFQDIKKKDLEKWIEGLEVYPVLFAIY